MHYAQVIPAGVCPELMNLGMNRLRLHGGREEGGVAEDVERVFGGGHEQGLALAHLDAVDVGFTPQADHNDERVAMEIDLLCHLNDYAMHDEVGAVDELRDGTCAVVGCPVLGPHLVVDGVLGLLDVEFARLAMGILASEVIYAVGDVAGLLDFGEEASGSDGMQTSGREEEQVALMCLVGGYDICHGILALA